MKQGETIFLQTDTAFNAVLLAIKELGDKKRLHVKHCQRAWIKGIESNDKDDNKKDVFGGESATTKGVFHFSQTASAVVRMCMLEAVGIHQDLIPRIREFSHKRNCNKMEKEVLIEPLFCLAEDKQKASYYWSKYDQLYPHFRIQEEVGQAKTEKKEAKMPSMMLIFLNDIKRVIEITTTFTAKPKQHCKFKSYVNVTCIVRDISEGPCTENLKALMQPLNIREEYFKEVMEISNKENAESLKSPLRDEDSEEGSEEVSEPDEKENNEVDSDEDSVGDKDRDEDSDEASDEDSVGDKDRDEASDEDSVGDKDRDEDSDEASDEDSVGDKDRDEASDEDSVGDKDRDEDSVDDKDRDEDSVGDKDRDEDSGDDSRTKTTKKKLTKKKTK